MAKRIGDHNLALTDRERQAEFFSYARKDLEIETQLKELRETRKSNRKLASAVGIPSAKIQYYVGLMNAEDKQKPIDKLAEEREVLEWVGLLGPAPKDLLDDRATKEQRAYAAGQAAGMLATDDVSGFAKDSPEDKAFKEGYADGQKAMVEDLAKAMEKRLAAKQGATPPDADPFAMKGKGKTPPAPDATTKH